MINIFEYIYYRSYEWNLKCVLLLEEVAIDISLKLPILSNELVVVIRSCD